MAKAKKLDITGHRLIIDEGTHHLAGLILKMLSFVKFEYPASYKIAVDTQFPGLFEKADVLSDVISETDVWSHIDLDDDEAYTLYTCYDLVGKLYVSDLYERVIEELYEDRPSPHPPDVMKQVYQHTLAKIQPFLVGTELYAKKTNTLPRLGYIKKQLDSLPMLD